MPLRLMVLQELRMLLTLQQELRMLLTPLEELQMQLMLLGRREVRGRSQRMRLRIGLSVSVCVCLPPIRALVDVGADRLECQYCIVSNVGVDAAVACGAKV